jgi:hypothetical protein
LQALRTVSGGKMSISRDVLAAVNELGFSLTAKPEYEIPVLPRDITELDDEGLMDLFVQFTQWNDHLAGAHAIAIINEREAQRNLDTQEAASMLRHWTGAKGDRVALIKAQIASTNEVKELQHELDVKYAFRKIIETRTLNVERDSQVVSRELTRRTSDGGGMRARTRKFNT